MRHLGRENTDMLRIALDQADLVQRDEAHDTQRYGPDHERKREHLWKHIGPEGPGDIGKGFLRKKLHGTFACPPFQHEIDECYRCRGPDQVHRDEEPKGQAHIPLMKLLKGRGYERENDATDQPPKETHSRHMDG